MIKYGAVSIITPDDINSDKIVVIGALSKSEHILKLLIDKNSDQHICFVDVNGESISNSPGNIEFLSLDSAYAKYPDTVVVLTTRTDIHTYRRIRETFPKVYQYQESWPDIGHTRELLANDISREVLEQHDKMLKMGVYIDGFSAAAGSLYEHGAVKAEPGEKIISIGTFQGTPLRLFSATTGGDFEAHCFEPNLNIFSDLCRNIVTWQMEDKVAPICAGVWSNTGMTAYVSDGFSGYNTSGKLIDLASANLTERKGVGAVMYSYSIDDYVQKSGFTPSMIESGRISNTIEILGGAIETIKNYKPKIIFVDYPHTDSVSFLKKIVPEYEIYYSECGRRKFGAFFAIAEKKKKKARPSLDIRDLLPSAIRKTDSITSYPFDDINFDRDEFPGSSTMSNPNVTKIRDLLCDKISIDLFEQHDYMLRKGFHIENTAMVSGTQFAHPEVHAEKGDKIIAVGPYYGNLLKAFSNYTKGLCEIHCFEANAIIYAQLCRNIVSWGLSQSITPVCAGIWSSSGMVAFASGGHTGGGDVIELNDKQSIQQPIDMAIQAYTIDEYVSQTGFIPTLIESERIGIAWHVLKGAEKTIRKYKPKIIFLEYPDNESVSLLKEFDPNYDIYYSECGRIKYGAFYAK